MSEEYQSMILDIKLSKSGRKEGDFIRGISNYDLLNQIIKIREGTIAWGPFSTNVHCFWLFFCPSKIIIVGLEK